jgi:hypothetical protein
MSNLLKNMIGCISNSAYLLLLDKKTPRDLDFTMADPHASFEEVLYHYTDAYGSKINHDKV